VLQCDRFWSDCHVFPHIFCSSSGAFQCVAVCCSMVVPERPARCQSCSAAVQTCVRVCVRERECVCVAHLHVGRLFPHTLSHTFSLTLSLSLTHTHCVCVCVVTCGVIHMWATSPPKGGEISLRSATNGSIPDFLHCLVVNPSLLRLLSRYILVSY